MPLPVAVEILALHDEGPRLLGLGGGDLPLPDLPANGRWYARPALMNGEPAPITRPVLEALVAWARRHQVPALDLCGQHDAWLDRLESSDLAAIDRLPDLVDLRLALHGDDLSGAAINHLGDLPGLRRLTVTSRILSASTVAGLARFPRLSELAIEVGDEAAVAALDRLPDLRALSLVCDDQLDDLPAGWRPAAGLERLELVRIGVGATGWRHLAGLARLSHLRIDAETATAQAPGLPTLRELTIGVLPATLVAGSPELRKVTAQSLDCAAARQLARLAHLEELDLGSAQVDDEAFAALGKATSLRRLNLHNARPGKGGLVVLAGLARLEHLVFPTEGTDTDLKAVSRLPALTSLVVKRGYRLSAHGFAALAGMHLGSLVVDDCETMNNRCLAHVAALTGLRRLVLRRCRKVTDGGLGSLAACRELEELDLWGTGVTSIPPAFMSRFPRMRRFNGEPLGRSTGGDDAVSPRNAAPDTWRLTVSDPDDDDAAALARLPLLAVLDLRLSRPAAGIAGVLAACVGLRRLRLEGAAIGDPELAALGQLPALAELTLADAACSDDGVAALARIPTLRRLALVRVGAIGDAALAALGHLPHLTHLRLDACPHVSGGGLDSWPDGHGLRTLDIEHASGLTTLAGLAHLARIEDLKLGDALVDDRLWPQLLECRTLRTVGITRCRRLTWTACERSEQTIAVRPVPEPRIYHDIPRRVAPEQVVSRVREKRLRKTLRFAATHPGRLEPAVVAALTRLGARVDGTPPAWSANLAAALRELLTWSWPAGTTFATRDGASPVAHAVDCSAPFPPEAVETMLCLQGRRFFGLGFADGGDRLVLVPCDTDMAEDPPCYLVAHEAYHNEDADGLHPVPLSGWLASLDPLA